MLIGPQGPPWWIFFQIFFKNVLVYPQLTQKYVLWHSKLEKSILGRRELNCHHYWLWLNKWYLTWSRDCPAARLWTPGVEAPLLVWMTKLDCTCYILQINYWFLKTLQEQRIFQFNTANRSSRQRLCLYTVSFCFVHWRANIKLQLHAESLDNWGSED